MPRIEFIDETPYAAGDPWSSGDAEGLSRPMLSMFDALVLRHAKADGKHKDPRVPIAAALVTCSGTTYTLRNGYNVGSLTRMGVGAVKVSLSGVTLAADSWGAEVSCIINDTLHLGSYYDTTTTTAVNVQLVTSAGAAADVSFLLLVYGAAT